MNLQRNLRHALALSLLAGWISPAHADAFFGPQVFTRDAGAPQELTESFELRGQASSFKLIVKNGLPDGTRRVSSAWVSLNGEQILVPSDFNQQVAELRRPVTLLPINELRVRLAGTPGGLLTISVSAVVGPTGGFVESPAGARLTIPPGAVAEEIAIGLRDASLAETGISLPSGYAFLGAVAVDLSGRELAAEADLAIPVSPPPAGRAIASRVLELETLKRLVLADTASVAADGLLHTSSPSPLPGLRRGGTYLFTEMPADLGILGVTASSEAGQPLKGALVDVLVDSAGETASTALVTQALESAATFIGQTDAAGLAAVPGLAPGNNVALLAIASPDSGSAESALFATKAALGSLQGSLVTTTLPGLPDIVSSGFVGPWLQNLVLHSLNIDPDDLPDLPPQCPCTLLLVNPHQIPASAIPFRSGNTQDLQVFCSPQEPDVTQSDSTSDFFDFLTGGLSAHLTGYHSTRASVAAVSQDGRVTAVSPGSTDIYVWTLFAQLFTATIGPHTVVLPFHCFAAGGVHPVVVSARVHVSPTGSGFGTVQSSLPGIHCPPDCDAFLPPGRSVTLTASANPDSRFVGWGGDCSSFGASPAATVITDADQSCSAEFRLRPPLTVTKTGRGTGTVSSQPPGIFCGATCMGRFDEGSVVTLTASPDAGSQFVRWAGDCAGTAATTNVTMNGARSCTAEFEGGIRVVSASYGSGNCRTPVGNVTGTVANLCNSRIECTVFVHNGVFGDPAFGCPKDFSVQWQCGADPAVRSAGHGPVAGEGYNVGLTCR
jgi:ABC-type cobalt transport system substrate-binding protein